MYFSFFKPPDWRKRSVVRGRGFIQRFPSSLTFHSDRGKQYTSATFTALLQKCGVKQSFSATARPHDNAVAETFFASFKKEEAYRREYTSEQSYRKSVEQYIRFYNELRPHRTLKYKPPQDSIPFWTILISISLPPFLNFICTDGQMSETEGRGWAAGLQTYTSYVCTLNILCFPAWKNKTSFDRWTLLK